MLKKDAHLVEKGTRGFEELFHPLQGNRKKKHVVSRVNSNMKIATAVLFWGLWFAQCVKTKTFPCSFNSYEESKDGRITMEEFLNYTRKHGYDAKQSQFVFGTFDSNGDGQIEVSEFHDNLSKLQRISLIGHCTRSADNGISVLLIIRPRPGK